MDLIALLILGLLFFIFSLYCFVRYKLEKARRELRKEIGDLSQMKRLLEGDLKSKKVLLSIFMKNGYLHKLGQSVMLGGSGHQKETYMSYLSQICTRFDLDKSQFDYLEKMDD